MGSGVQTTACLIKYYFDYDFVVFADTGNESKETYEYVEKYLKPFCEKKGIPFITVRHEKDGKMYSVLDEAVEHVAVERYFSQRQCTGRHKIRPVLNWIRKNVPCGKNNPCIVDIGFSVDESHRIGPDYPQQYVKKNYPLTVDRITRQGCKDIITQHGWKVPPNSACEFCPYLGKKHMREFSKREPGTFQILVAAENRDNRTIFRGCLLYTSPSPRDS